jgi:Alkylmercury lyase
VTDRELALRRSIFEAFAATGEPPPVDDIAALRSLAAQHIVVLDEADRIVMAHPFAAHDDGARVDAGGRTWRGSCAWDAFGIVAALGLDEAVVTDASGVRIAFRGGRPVDQAIFHVAVPAAHWWDDIGFT